jgi:hypothetical protein
VNDTEPPVALALAAIRPSDLATELRSVLDKLSDAANKPGAAPRLFFPYGINEIMLTLSTTSITVHIKGPDKAGT